MEMLLCYEDEGVYVNTYGRIIKDVVLQWGEMPTSVGECGAGPSRRPRLPGLAWEWAWAAAHSLPHVCLLLQPTSAPTR